MTVKRTVHVRFWQLSGQANEAPGRKFSLHIFLAQRCCLR